VIRSAEIPVLLLNKINTSNTKKEDNAITKIQQALYSAGKIKAQQNNPINPMSR
jgi:hypothetical protein